jgi:hypothetical protein
MHKVRLQGHRREGGVENSRRGQRRERDRRDAGDRVTSGTVTELPTIHKDTGS